MKKVFTAGLAILLPIVLTMMIVGFLVNILTSPFLEPTRALINHFDFIRHSFFLFDEKSLITIISKILILLSLICLISIVGLFGKLFLIDYFFRMGNHLVQRLPFVNKIYQACQDVVHSLFSSSKSFSQVVLVPFPNANNLSVGFVTGDSIKIEQSQCARDFVSVFVPGTPNPSVGFLIMFKKEQLTFVNMKVDEAMKFIISCGVVMPDFVIIQPDVPYEIQLSYKSDILSCQR